MGVISTGATAHAGDNEQVVRARVGRDVGEGSEMNMKPVRVARMTGEGEGSEVRFLVDLVNRSKVSMDSGR